MANIKSQKKRILTNEKRQERNKAVKSELKTRLKNANRSIGTDTQEDSGKAAVKRVIHKNAAARKKSRLMKRVNASA